MQTDKVAHFLVGLCIMLISVYFTHELWGMLFVLVAAAGKELWDHRRGDS
jgi:hypothetical protein